MDQLFSLSAFSALGQVILIDIALAADNAVVIGMAAAGLEAKQRRQAIIWGIVAATVMRIGFASVTVQLLNIIGLVLAGGILLLWVCWKMWAELHPEGVRAAIAGWRERRRNGGEAPGAAHAQTADEVMEDGTPRKSMRQAITQIVVADVSMSLDNVLAVAGAAREHPWAMVFGLVLSIAMMGAASMAIARLLERHKWIAYAGLAVVFYVALKMLVEGGEQVMHSGILP